jgi:hypothetical protein
MLRRFPLLCLKNQAGMTGSQGAFTMCLVLCSFYYVAIAMRPVKLYMP